MKEFASFRFMDSLLAWKERPFPQRGMATRQRRALGFPAIRFHPNHV
jgi:hypothetical protein